MRQYADFVRAPGASPQAAPVAVIKIELPFGETFTFLMTNV